jgi:hypothetical protein
MRCLRSYSFHIIAVGFDAKSKDQADSLAIITYIAHSRE